MTLLMAALLMAAGCTAAPPPPSSTLPPPPSPSPSPPARAAPTSGCQAARRLEPGTHRIRHGGLERRFLLSVPDGPGPHPVILDLHGLNSDAARQSAYSRLADTGARRGYIVATPQAAEGRMGWTLPHTAGPDDTGFLTALLDHLERGLCVRSGREFAAGMSYGAAMATALICELNGRLTAVAAVAGLNLVRPCPRAVPPVTVVAFHGTADRIVPYRGGHPLRDATGGLRELADLVVLDPVEQAADGWAALLGCTGRTTAAQARKVRVRDWKTCRGGATLRLYTIDGGGHTWPGPIDVPWLGTTARDLDATALILDTFDRAPAR
ncbi:PHB depolymerase family esterase [Nonomuraea antimicrobica]|uniref:PHB depolymerase family esterase n=2 Tax=Nonomuraea antimicrobica TaxID=561173 RepID=A0ABP7BMP4_9ACTN